MGNISVKLFLIRTSGSRDVVERFFYFHSSRGHSVKWRSTICAILVEGIMGNICVKSF